MKFHTPQRVVKAGIKRYPNQKRMPREVLTFDNASTFLRVFPATATPAGGARLIALRNSGFC